MPGIVGFISDIDPQVRRARLDKMIGAMMHEPFYRSSSLVLDEFGLGVGWIGHPGSFSDCFPVWSEAKNVGLIFTGEHFADTADLKRIPGAGVRLFPKRCAVAATAL